ncbi:protoporphyrinogen oxidase [Rhinocladiella mackenziei CBS 650.93]|uniref:Protoporphyrinogen oxidase n=1 Tax=Rhinocladiella mackenziei CBS 650.93 TaxID=1442369 RepID=A0A0D2ILG0_9EURO|nr:protoporphyrinogen oxidase [Rhinocladiella mackenziei CBS 650.93]KIX04016.1 protoporphyrinogen oxidase [Rhinocladiella mackenziei CBS 650.93]
MRLVCHKALYHHVVKHALQLQPRARQVQFLRTFNSTSDNANHHQPSFVEQIDALREDLTSKTTNPSAQKVAVLGGGITGLAAALHLRWHVDAEITVYEKSSRLGGWIDSEVVQVDDGKVLFEWGPRTLRPGLEGTGISTADMLARLDHIRDELLIIPKASPAATNRYIFYPDHLTRMPAPSTDLIQVLRNVYGLFTEPIFHGMFQALWNERFVAQRNPKVRDESVGDFLQRRVGKSLTDNIVSSIFHGIYAGDIYKLSARTLLPVLWYLEIRNKENFAGISTEMAQLTLDRLAIGLQSASQFSKLRWFDAPDSTELLDVLERASVYTFKRGLGQLISSLETVLNRVAKMRILKSSPVEDVTFDKKTQKISIKTKDTTSTYDYVVSSLDPSAMKQFMARNANTRGVTFDQKVATACDHSNVSVSVMVVNLFYSNPDLIPRSIRGFGYLIPRSVPLDQNPERALGTIFSSESSRDDSRNESQDTASGTKLTVMMGGHWWDGWAPSDLPDEKQAIEMAKSLLRRHLNINELPVVAKARLNRDCIPQYPVGYRDDMATIHDALLSQYEGRLKVAGPWWQGGVGINDCIHKARLASWAIKYQWDDQTGLEDYAVDERWLIKHRDTGEVQVDPGH